jgi:hypothetical protein
MAPTMLAAVEIGKEDLQFINTHVRQWRRQYRVREWSGPLAVHSI